MMLLERNRGVHMFVYDDLLREYSDSLQDSIGMIINSSRMILTNNQEKAVCDVISRVFSVDSDGALKKPSKNTPKNLLVNRGDNSGGRAVINIMPSSQGSEYITDTLVYYCLGADSLEKSLDRMLIQVGKFKYKNVFFITSKWDNAVVTGINKQRLLDMLYYNSNNEFCTNFTILLKSPFSITTVLAI